MDVLKRTIETFEFDPEWEGTGILTENLCRDLLSNWDTGEDKNPEHYRYGVFRSMLSGANLSDKEFSMYINLAIIEFNTVLYASPIIDLIKYRFLSEEQKKSLMGLSSTFPPPAQKAINKWLKT